MRAVPICTLLLELVLLFLGNLWYHHHAASEGICPSMPCSLSENKMECGLSCICRPYQAGTKDPKKGICSSVEEARNYEDMAYQLSEADDDFTSELPSSMSSHLPQKAELPTDVGPQQPQQNPLSSGGALQGVPPTAAGGSGVYPVEGANGINAGGMEYEGGMGNGAPAGMGGNMPVRGGGGVGQALSQLAMGAVGGFGMPGMGGYGMGMYPGGGMGMMPGMGMMSGTGMMPGMGMYPGAGYGAGGMAGVGMRGAGLNGIRRPGYTAYDDGDYISTPEQRPSNVQTTGAAQSQSRSQAPPPTQSSTPQIPPHMSERSPHSVPAQNGAAPPTPAPRKSLSASPPERPFPPTPAPRLKTPVPPPIPPHGKQATPLLQNKISPPVPPRRPSVNSLASVPPPLPHHGKPGSLSPPPLPRLPQSLQPQGSPLRRPSVALPPLPPKRFGSLDRPLPPPPAKNSLFPKVELRFPKLKLKIPKLRG
uniref:Putative was/wasl-interacting protein family member 1 n=1 Tax=Amblyomma triste TaxID=251400 RepID=A0A023G660_AMBTT